MPVYGTTGRAVAINQDATLGAQMGVDLFGEDGRVLTLARLKRQLGRPAGAVNPVIHEDQIVDGALLARLTADESVTGRWRFAADLRLGGGATIAGSLPVARPAGVHLALDVLSATARAGAYDGTKKVWQPLELQASVLRVRTGTAALTEAWRVDAAGIVASRRATFAAGLHVAGDVASLGTASTGITAFLATTADEARLGAIQWSSGGRRDLNIEASSIDCQIGSSTPASVLRIQEAEVLALQTVRSEKGLRVSGEATLPGSLFQPISLVADTSATVARLRAYKGATQSYQPLELTGSQIDIRPGNTMKWRFYSDRAEARSGQRLRIFNATNSLSTDLYHNTVEKINQFQIRSSSNKQRFSLEGFSYYRLDGPLISRTGGLYIQGKPIPQNVSGPTLFMDVRNGAGRFGAYDYSAGKRIPIQVEGITIRLRANGVVSFIARNDYVEIQEAKLWANKGLAVQNSIHKITALRGVFSFLDTATVSGATYGRVGAYQYDVAGWRNLHIIGSTIALRIDDATKMFLGDTDVQIRSGTTLRVFNSSNASAMELAHNGVNGDVIATSGDINFLTGNTEQAKIRRTLGVGQTSTMRLRDHALAWRDVALAGRKESRTNQSFTLAAEDANNFLFFDAATAHTVTLAASTDLDFPVGADVVLLASGTGTVTIRAGAGTTLYSVGGGTRPLATGNRSVRQGVLHIWRRSATAYYSFNERGVS